MIWILLATLGVPIWLIVGALGAALWSRRRIRRVRGVFPCKVRVISGPDHLGGWPRSTAHARWVHDVLIVHSGLALLRNRVLPVAGVEASTARAPVDVQRAGAVSIEVRLDDGTVAEIAAPASMQTTLVGPFLTMEDARSSTNGVTLGGGRD